MKNQYICIKQRNINDCGIACLAIICKHYGVTFNIPQIKKLAGIDRKGTNVFGIVKAAKQLGFCANGLKGDKEDFLSDYPLPCIAHMVIDGALQHYVVIHKIENNKVIIADPGCGLVELELEEFFGEATKDGKDPKYKWSGVLITMIPNSNQDGYKTKGIWERIRKRLTS